MCIFAVESNGNADFKALEKYFLIKMQNRCTERGYVANAFFQEKNPLHCPTTFT